jgi:hypothetical protein
MRKKWIWGVFFLFLSFFVGKSVFGAASFSTGTIKFGEKELKSLLLENEYYRLVIVPDRGGRIVEWIDKKAGNVNVINLPTSSENPNYGGLLDDHGWASSAGGFGDYYNFNYVYDLKATGPEEVTVELWPFEQKHYSRTISLKAGSPLIKISYTFHNIFQTDGGNILIRNVIWPSGKGEPDDHFYSTPLQRKGILTNTSYVNTAQGANADKVSAFWRAFGSLSQKRLIGFAFCDNLYEGAYDWEGSRIRPTFEWYYHGVPKGKSVTTEMYAYIAHGLYKSVHLSEKAVADLDINRIGEEIELTWKVASIDPSVQKLTLSTRILDLEGKEIAQLAPITLSSLKPDTLQQGRLLWKSSQSKPILVEQSLEENGLVIGRYRIPFELGKIAYTQEPVSRKKALFSDIPGWKPILPLQLVIGEEDKKRGYLLYSAEGEGKGTTLQKISCDIGVNEYESYEVRFLPLKEDLGKVRLDAIIPSGLTEKNISLTATERRTVKIWGSERVGWKLLQEKSFLPEKEKEERIWLIVNSKGVKPEEYTIGIRISPEKGIAVTVPLTMRVLPLQMPEDRHFYLEPNSHLNQLGLPPGVRGTKRWEWTLKGTEVYADDLESHGMRMLKAYAYGTAPGQSLVSLKLRDSGKFLMDALKENPALLQQDPLPALDLSFWDPWLQLWIDRGFIHYSTHLGGLGKGFFSSQDSFAKKYNADSQKVRRWLSSEASRYLKEKGYRYVYGTISDEIAPDLFPAWKEVAQDTFECGWSPGVTISSGFFKNKDIYPLAGPLMEYWVIGDPQADLIAKAKKDGYITKASSVGSYDGWGTWFRDYSHMRASMWNRAYNDTEVFWVQCYIRGATESVVFHENNIPYGSGSWEGMRDGCEDANYVKGAMGMIAALQPSQRQPYQKRLKEIIESIDKEDPSTLRQAKSSLFLLLIDLKKRLPSLKASLAWQDLPVIDRGKPLFILSSGKEGNEARELFQKKISQKTGITLQAVGDSKSIRQNVIVFGHPDTNLLLKEIVNAGIDLGVTRLYPALDSYIIKEVSFKGKKLLAVIGKGEGLLKGAENFTRFLTVDSAYPNQYFLP